MANENSFNDRKLTFAQRHLGEELPRQLKPDELPNPLRFALWEVIETDMRPHTTTATVFMTDRVPRTIKGYWASILYDLHRHHLHRPHDLFFNTVENQYGLLRQILTESDYRQVYGMLDFVLQHPKCPPALPSTINAALTANQAAWRVYDRNQIGRVGLPEEGRTIEQAFIDLVPKEFGASKVHLKAAIAHLTHGKFADSICESIDAVEAISRVIEPKGNTLNAALRRLVGSGLVNRNLSQALERLYAWTGDEPGLRHSLVFDDKADVDEADALFMAGACAAFASYLIARARQAPPTL